MSRENISIKSFATIDESGIVTSKARIGWDADQNGPQDIRRAQVLPTAYVAFGKLNLPDKLAFSAASLALRDCTDCHDNKMGVFLAIPGGSFSTDCLYRDSIVQGNPSPALFSATLPSSPVADIAIYHHLTGPNIVFAGGDLPFFSTLHYVTLMLRCRRLEEALIVFVNEPVGTVQTAITDRAASVVPSATALLLGTSPGYGSLKLSFEHNADVTTPKLMPVADTLLSKNLTATLEKSASARLPVCGGGFRGYICLNKL